jgi:hypothetical protein
MQEKLIKISNYVDKIAAYAHKDGSTFTQHDLQETIALNKIDEKKASQADGTLNEKDLEKVAGGTTIKTIAPFLF